MTRETKIGLLLGMGVILLIGIIISDHLSGVQQQDAADFTGFGAEAQRSIESSDAAPGIPGHQIAQPANQQESTSPVIEAPNNFFIPDPSNDAEMLRARQAQATPGNGPSHTDATAEETSQSQQKHLLFRAGDEVPTVTFGNAPAPLPHMLNNAITIPQPATSPGIRHTVLGGETLFKIAERHYGNGEYWRAIAQANPGKVTRDGQVRQGIVLDIPKRAESDLGSDFIPVGSGRLIPVDHRTPRNTSRVIVVVSGDTLSELATKHLGSATRWEDLLKANRDKLDSPEALKVGMKLRLPGASDQPPLDTPTASGTAGKPAKTKTYTVRAGDNLTQIAERTLGDGDKWRDVYQANKGTLKSPDRLVVGQKLIIPG